MAGYGTDGGFATWLADNGYAVSGSLPLVVLRQRGSVYIDGAYGERFCGQPTGGIEQDRAWPRIGAAIYGTTVADSVIPVRVIEASYMAAYLEGTSPGSLIGAVVSGASLIKRERVDGAVEVEYAVSDKTDIAAAARVIVPAIEGLLAPLLRTTFPGVGVVVV